MSTRTLITVFGVVVVILLAVIVFQSQMQKAQPVAQEQTQEAAPAPASGMPQSGGPVDAPPANASPGLVWRVPANWNTLDARPMRLATYGIPAAAGNGEGAECAVFYFGPDQGGGVQENLSRWVGQFEHASDPEHTQATVGGFQVFRVTVKGDYLAPSGPMMQSTGSKHGYALIGAIVEGPSGRVFFKLTGPEKTVEAASGEFDDMLKTLKKG